MTNDKVRMTKEVRSPNDERLAFWFRRSSFLLVASVLMLGGCGRSANLPDGAAAPVVDAFGAPAQVDQAKVATLSRSDLEPLAAAVDRYCQALRQLGGRAAVRVNLSFTDVTDGEMAKLVFPTATDSVNLSNTAIGDQTVTRLVKLSGLRTVLLSSTQVTDHSLGYLQQLPQLAAADLMRTQVSSDGSAALEAFLQPRVAAAGSAARTEAPAGWRMDPAVAATVRASAEDVDRYADAVAAFGGTVELDLDFSRLPLTDADVQGIALPRCVRGMDLSYAKITDQTLESLQELAGLERIALVKTAIGDEGVKHLIAMPNLCEANLEGTSVSFDMRMALVRAMAPHLSAKARRHGH